MNLAEFIASDYRTMWIEDSGLSYYVRKSIGYRGLIELANCTAMEDPTQPLGRTIGGMWKFLRKYSSTVPFKMEQVLNRRLAEYVRKIGWSEERIGGIPQFYSPLAMSTYDIVLPAELGPDMTLELEL